MIYAFESFTIDADRFQLSGPDGAIEAEPQALEFLIHMIRHRGQLVTKEALHEAFWPDRVVSDAALSTLVRNARRLIGDSGEEQRVIATRHGRGFVFRAEVREIDRTGPARTEPRDAAPLAKPRVEGAPTIVVLPFEIVGDTADASGLSEGVTEEVMAALARARWFPLIARNRVRTFLEFPPEQRGPFRQLGASYLVEGGVFRDGDDVRLHLQLTDTRPALHIHVSRHELEYTGLFKLLDEISTIVTATIQPELLEAERLKAEAIASDARTAWQEFVLGQHLISAPDKAANQTARAHFERALELEPGSGRIHAGLAMTHLWDYKYDWTESAELSLGAAARDAERALRLAPDDSWALSILAICKQTLRRFDAALADAQKAIEIDPASAMAHGCLCWVLAYTGRYDEALNAFDRAVALSPRDRRRGLWLTGRAIAQFGLGDFAASLETGKQMVALSPDHPSGHRVTCASLSGLGRDADARQAAATLMSLLPDHDVDQAIARQPFQPGLGAAYAKALRRAGLTGSADTAVVRKPNLPPTTDTAPYPLDYTLTHDGVSIAWSRMGSGPPLVLGVRWLGNLGLDHENPLSRDIVGRLAERFTLIQFDHRGMGQSQRDVEGLTLADMAMDLDAVVAAAGLDRFSVFTMSHGCAVAFTYLHRNPDRVARMAVYGSSLRGWRHPEWGDAIERTEAIMAVARLGWDAEEPTFRRMTVQAVLPDIDAETSAWLDGYLRQTINARMSVQVIDAIGDYDFEETLAGSDLPVLAIHATDDRAVPIHHGRQVVATLPNAAFLEVPSRNNAFTQIDETWPATLKSIMNFLEEGST